MNGLANQYFQTDALNCKAATNVQYDYKGEFWTLQDTGRGGGYWHITFPNQKACDGSGVFTSNLIGINYNNNPVGSLIGPSSSHPGGVNMLFLDGSVKFIKDSVAAQPYYAIATPSGAEVFASDTL